MFVSLGVMPPLIQIVLDVPKLRVWCLIFNMTLWTLNTELLVPAEHCVLINTWIMKLFNGRRSLIISDDKWRSVLLLSSNLYLSDVEVRLINLTFLAHQPFSSFNVRVPSKKLLQFPAIRAPNECNEYWKLLRSWSKAACFEPLAGEMLYRLGQNLSESLSSPRLPRYCLGYCHSHWLRQILQTIKHEARGGLEPRRGQ